MIRNRFILLGASNLTLSLRLIVKQIQNVIKTPSDIYVAAGHGRSYGQFSQVIFRGLPGIKDCGMWQQIEQKKSAPTYALITDIGNDIPYQYTPEQILDWVHCCVTYLQKYDAKIVMTNIPLRSIERLSEQRYIFLRNLLYPYCQLSRAEVVACARILHKELIAMAASNQLKLVEQAPEWFGFDGIHVSFWKRAAFCRYIIDQFRIDTVQDLETSAEAFLYNGWKKRPKFFYQTIFGRGRYCPQPSGRLFDDSPVSLF